MYHFGSILKHQNAQIVLCFPDPIFRQPVKQAGYTFEHQYHPFRIKIWVLSSLSLMSKTFQPLLSAARTTFSLEATLSTITSSSASLPDFTASRVISTGWG